MLEYTRMIATLQIDVPCSETKGSWAFTLCNYKFNDQHPARTWTKSHDTWMWCGCSLEPGSPSNMSTFNLSPSCFVTFICMGCRTVWWSPWTHSRNPPKNGQPVQSKPRQNVRSNQTKFARMTRLERRVPPLNLHAFILLFCLGSLDYCIWLPFPRGTPWGYRKK